ncbi:methionine ABC transporter ATP-binding protein [Corynebacterium otitidis]|uniref:D-methionine transport system ATP-binding protein n=1 Tax=Corynebacterium otitidis ATCC 51513 TaxID=883169 RepID=I7IXE0_9CORY|nr:methionine ABC transporter ATP-binding protein [Corynebacterium otitidis]EJZ81816.1 hypothetical protein HMPREF9719_01237 [Corynebacterium otitidis ATCC 51513]CCI83743.1 D-methionine transport system ATP-binding protein [Corynebacterium otitidis ATCC 51513]
MAGSSDTDASPIVSFRDVTKTFDGQPALDSISFEVGRGQVFGVVGPSGAGKSTLLRTVNGLEKPTSGEVEVLGQDPARLSRSGLRRLRGEVSMIFQHYNLLGSGTVRHNVAMPLVIQGREKNEIERRVDEALELVGLADKADARPGRLSGGQQQRVGIARALVTDPKVLLCDEPTSALDPLTTAQILSLIGRVNEELGITVVIITHQMDVIARIADAVAVLDDGHLIELGEAGEVIERPREELTARFVETVVPRALPADVAAEVRSGEAGRAVAVSYTGRGARDVIGEASRRFGARVRLLHATETSLRRGVVGRQVLGIDGERAAEAVDWILGLEGIRARELRPEDVAGDDDERRGQ